MGVLEHPPNAKGIRNKVSVAKIIHLFIRISPIELILQTGYHRHDFSLNKDITTSCDWDYMSGF
ncbi:MAG: hypothetical protein NPINA01_23560 [Nitrospinaceae bacterium]|nr:MAG: hypothetical protein NPINA01_23560 [Nitrospinaceae bacterium]